MEWSENLLKALSEASKAAGLGSVTSAWAPKERSPVPPGVAVFISSDVAIRRFAEQGNTIVHWSEFDRGGHFAAMEAPDLVVSEVRTFFRRLQ